jgi:prepilin signal peptidase PulO-like enzyme (type II secretory pathway)
MSLLFLAAALPPFTPTPVLLAYGFFFFLLGACVGSFLNVVIWRLPHRGHEVIYLNKRGPLTLSWPPSHCPMCDAPIAWYQNIPVFSYIALRARCAKCAAQIPIRYPLVELATALLWSGLFLAYFLGGWTSHSFPWQLDLAGHRLPVLTDFHTGWPVYVVHALMASALLAASATDADLFVIPLAITWFLTLLGLGASLFLGPPFTTSIAQWIGAPKNPDAFALIPALSKSTWLLAKPIVGATLGLILANILLALKILPRSFASLPQPVQSESDAPHGKSPKQSEEPSAPPKEEPLAPPQRLTKFLPSVLAVLVLLAILVLVWTITSAAVASLATLCAAILIFLIGVLPRDAGEPDVTDEVLEEISDPHVRQEMLKELLFCAIPVAAAIVLWLLPVNLPRDSWLARLLGSLLGFLIGGGLLWFIRIAGSLYLGKEAMGIGDAHLMAGVGAILGAPLIIIAFFLSPFLALAWAAVLIAMKKPNVLPFGPWLSIASILSLAIGNHLILLYIHWMFP